MKVVVYLKSDYAINKTIWVEETLIKEQVTEKVNKEFGEWL